MKTRKIKIISTGTGLPEKVLHDYELDERLGLPKGETFRITGVRQRYQSVHETAAVLAARACGQAIMNSSLKWDDIDCLVSTSATMDKALPYNAAMIHSELGLSHRRTTTFDVGASCMSFLTGLDMISYAVDAGRFRNVMFVSSDVSAFTVDYKNLRENGIFGDGAAAVIISKSEENESSCIVHSDTVTVSEGVDFCRINSGGTRYHRRTKNSNCDAFFEMNGRGVFALASREITPFMDKLFLNAGCRMEDIDVVVPHQASRLGIDHIATRLNIPKGKLVDIFADHGNQVGASLPTALHFGISSGKIQRGNRVLFIGTGAGLTIGGMVMIY